MDYILQMYSSESSNALEKKCYEIRERESKSQNSS